MRKILIIIILQLLNVANSLSSDLDRNLLHDMPPINNENLRFLLPLNQWIDSPGLTLKGAVYQIIIPQKKELYLNVYRDSSLKGEPLFKFTGGAVVEGNKEICIYGYDKEPEELKNFIRCKKSSCIQVHEKSPQKIYDLYFLNQKLMEHIDSIPTGKECRFKYEMIPLAFKSSNGEEVLTFNFKNPILSKDGKALELNVNNQKMYIDIKPCFSRELSCSLKMIEISQIEQRWIDLKKDIIKKDHTILNDLQKNLGPCLQPVNEKCIRDNFANLADAEINQIDLYENKINVNAELISELKECLKYESLLPHRLGSKGLKNVCIFGKIFRNKIERGGLLSISYPEAIRESADPREYEAKPR